MSPHSAMSSFLKAIPLGFDVEQYRPRRNAKAICRPMKLLAFSSWSGSRNSATALGCDVSGSVAIEFAFIGLMIMLLFLEAMQAGFYLYTEAALDRATSKSARQILTGSIANQGMTADNFRTNVLCPLLAPGMSCANVVTNIQTVSEGLYPGGFYNYVDSSQAGLITPAMDNTKTAFCPGQNGSYVYIQVYYAMPTFSPVWLALGSTIWNGNKVRFISSTAAFKNEPFQLSGQYSGTC